jgi:hypothetical protein
MDQLELAGYAVGIDPVEECEEGVMGFDFAGVQRNGLGSKPTVRHGNALFGLLGFEVLDEAVQASTVFGGHVHELQAHAFAGAAMPNAGSSADLAAAGCVKEDFDQGSGGEGLNGEEIHPAHTDRLRPRDVAFAPALPGNQQIFGRVIPGLSTAILLCRADERLSSRQNSGMVDTLAGWCSMG